MKPKCTSLRLCIRQTDSLRCVWLLSCRLNHWPANTASFPKTHMLFKSLEAPLTPSAVGCLLWTACCKTGWSITPARGRMSGLGYSNTRDAALQAVGGRRGMRGNLKQASTHLSPWFCPPSPHRLTDSFIFRCEGSIFRNAWRGYKLAVLHRNAEMLNSVGVHYFLRQQVRLSKEVEFLSWPYGSLFTVLQYRIIRSTFVFGIRKSELPWQCIEKCSFCYGLWWRSKEIRRKQ